MKFLLVLFLITNVFLSLSTVFSKEEGKTWAVLVVGYDWYYVTYSFEGAIYKMYRALIDQGIPAEQIITISPDTAAFHPRNRNPGSVTYGRDSGPIESYPNYYEDVIIDYRNDVTEEAFYEILRGNKTKELLEYGSGKVLSSGPKDNVLFFYTGFAIFGYISIAGDDWTRMKIFIPFLENLKKNKHFNKLLMIWDSYEPGYIFDDYMDTDVNILTYSLGGRFNSQYFCHYNKYLRAITSTCAGFSLHTHTETSLATSGGKESINDCFQNAAYEGNNVDVVHNLYGQLEIGSEPIGNYFGFGANSKHSMKKHPKQLLDTDTESMRKFVKEQTKNAKTLKEVIEEDDTVPKKEKDRLANVMKLVIDESLRGTSFNFSQTENSQKLKFEQNEDYDNIFNEVRLKCFTKKNKIIFFLHWEKFLKLFSFRIPPQKISAAIKNNC